jgi:multidrug efflux pump subunit AcrB
MNAIVLIALKRPYTFVVLTILIAIFGGLAARRTPTDIFPDVRIPVVAVVWTYTGLTPEDISGRVIYYYERALTTTVDNVEHIESQSLYGRGIVKIFFQPGTDVAAAQAQVTAISQTVLKQLPAGITPPEVLAYNASSVAVLALEVSSKRLTGSQCLGRASASAGRRACGSSTTRVSGSGVGVSDRALGGGWSVQRLVPENKVAKF